MKDELWVRKLGGVSNLFGIFGYMGEPKSLSIARM
jgi:hypothetical protein